jgi:hypothetical protein
LRSTSLSKRRVAQSFVDHCVCLFIIFPLTIVYSVIRVILLFLIARFVSHNILPLSYLIIYYPFVSHNLLPLSYFIIYYPFVSHNLLPLSYLIIYYPFVSHNLLPLSYLIIYIPLSYLIIWVKLFSTQTHRLSFQSSLGNSNIWSVKASLVILFTIFNNKLTYVST